MRSRKKSEESRESEKKSVQREIVQSHLMMRRRYRRLMEMVDKKDGGKPMVDLLVPEFILELAKVLTMGAKKYNIDNWKKIDKRRYIAALYRHVLAYHGGEINDSESGLSHMAHAAANAMFIFWMDEVAPKGNGYEKGYRGEKAE